MLNCLFLSVFWKSRICRLQLEGIYGVILSSSILAPCFSVFLVDSKSFGEGLEVLFGDGGDGLLSGS